MVAEVVDGLGYVGDEAVEHVDGGGGEGDGGPHYGGGLSGGPGDTDDHPRQDPGEGRGDHHLFDGLPSAGAEGYAPLPEGVWNALQRLLARQDYGGQVHQPQDDRPGEEGYADGRHQEGEAEEAVDDGRDAVETSDGYGDDPLQPRISGVLVQVYCGPYAERG